MTKEQLISEVVKALQSFRVNLLPQPAKPYLGLATIGGRRVMMEGRTLPIVILANRRNPKRAATDLTVTLLALNKVSPIKGFMSQPCFWTDAEGNLFATAYPTFFKAALPALKEAMKVLEAAREK